MWNSWGCASDGYIHKYGDWAQWAQIPAGNVAERDEGLNNYVRSLTWNAYISEFGTPDERNDGRTQETAALSFIHMEYFVEMDELRQETMLTTTAAFAALKQPGGRGGGGGGSAMRAEKPAKMVAEMQTLELIDELKQIGSDRIRSDLIRSQTRLDPTRLDSSRTCKRMSRTRRVRAPDDDDDDNDESQRCTPRRL